MLESLFENVACLNAETLLKRDTDPGVYCKIVNTTSFEKHLLFYLFEASLSHGPKGSRSRLYDGIRLQGLSHRSIFLFSSWHEPSPSPRPTFENLRRISLMT